MINKGIFFLFLVFTSIDGLAQRPGEWFLERNPTGILARVYGTGYNGVEFMVVFEPQRGCEPIFSTLILNSQSLGNPISQRPFPPNNIYISVNGLRHTWHGAVAEYVNGLEIGVGITRDAWNNLLSDPKSINFIDANGKSFNVPTTNLSRVLRQGLQQCLGR